MDNGKIASTPSITEVLTAKSGVDLADSNSVEAKNNLNTTNPHLSWEQNTASNPNQYQPVKSNHFEAESDASESEPDGSESIAQSVKSLDQLNENILSMPPDYSTKSKPNAISNANSKGKSDFGEVVDGIKEYERELGATGNAASFVDKIMDAREAYQGRSEK